MYEEESVSDEKEDLLELLNKKIDVLSQAERLNTSAEPSYRERYTAIRDQLATDEISTLDAAALVRNINLEIRLGSGPDKRTRVIQAAASTGINLITSLTTLT